MGRCAGELHRDLLTAFGGRLATRSAATAERERATAGLAEAIHVTRPLAPELEALEAAARIELGRSTGWREQLQRIHGDLHVGQLLRVRRQASWRSTSRATPPCPPRHDEASHRRFRTSASLLLSLDHVAVAPRRRGFGAATAEAFAWSARAREAVVAGYAVSATPGTTSDPSPAAGLEVAKEWREAVYAARVLPEWLYAPRLVLEKLLA
jgi:predicted trehalose synthase